MASEFFNRIHRKILINTGASLSLHNQNEMNSFLKRTKEDLAKISEYINNIVYPIFQGPGFKGSPNPIACHGPKFEFDILQDGIAATTLQTYPEEHGGQAPPIGPECYWFSDGLGGGRPATIKETFDCLLSKITEQKVLFEEAEYDDAWIHDALFCLNSNDQRIIKDAFGCSYELNCIDKETFLWPLARHLFEIFKQVIIGHELLGLQGQLYPPGSDCPTGETAYPDLSININSCNITWDCCLELEKLCSICPTEFGGWPERSFRDDFTEHKAWTGWYCGGTPDYSTVEIDSTGTLVDLCSNFDPYLNVNLHDAIAITMHEVCKRTELAWSVIKVSSEAGGQIVGGDLTADERHDQIEFIAGPGIKITSNDPGGAPNSVESLKFEALPVAVPNSILGDLNDAYHFTDHPPYYLGVITLENTYENTDGEGAHHNWRPECVPLPGAGLYLIDDTPELKSKALAVVSDFKTGTDTLPDFNWTQGPLKSYFSVGTHWGVGKTDEMIASQAMTSTAGSQYKEAWNRFKVVHTEDSIFMMKRLADSDYAPYTAGSNAVHKIDCPNEGALWISSGSNVVRDACEKVLEKDHLYYRMPGNGLIWKLSHCPTTPGGGGQGGNLQDAYNFDKNLNQKHDGGTIKLKSKAITDNRSFWLMQSADFNTKFVDYWSTGDPYLDLTGSPAPGTNCPYYVPWFAITDYSVSGDNEVGAVTPTSINHVGADNRFFSVQMRDQCPLVEDTDCCCDWSDLSQELLSAFGGLTRLVFDSLSAPGTAPSGGWPGGSPPDGFVFYINWTQLSADGAIAAFASKGVTYTPGDCVWMSLDALDAAIPLAFSSYKMCLQTIQQWSAIPLTVGYDITASNGDVWVPLAVTPHVLALTPDPNGLLASQYLKIDPDCLTCPCEFDDVTKSFMYPYIQSTDAQGRISGTTYEYVAALDTSACAGLDVTKFLMSETELLSHGLPASAGTANIFYEAGTGVHMVFDISGQNMTICLRAERDIRITLPWKDSSNVIHGCSFTGAELIAEGVNSGVEFGTSTAVAVVAGETYWIISGPHPHDTSAFQLELPPCGNYDRGSTKVPRDCDCTRVTPRLWEAWDAGVSAGQPLVRDFGIDPGHNANWTALIDGEAINGAAPGYPNKVIVGLVEKAEIASFSGAHGTISYAPGNKISAGRMCFTNDRTTGTSDYNVDTSLEITAFDYGLGLENLQYYFIVGAPLIVPDGHQYQDTGKTSTITIGNLVLAEYTDDWKVCVTAKEMRTSAYAGAS